MLLQVLHELTVVNNSWRKNGHRSWATCTKIGKDRACGSGDILANSQTNRHRQTDRHTQTHRRTTHHKTSQLLPLPLPLICKYTNYRPTEVEKFLLNQSLKLIWYTDVALVQMAYLQIINLTVLFVLMANFHWTDSSLLVSDFNRGDKTMHGTA